MGLFANQPWFDNLQKPLEERWRSWAAQEARTRLAWAVFVRFSPILTRYHS